MSAKLYYLVILFILMFVVLHLVYYFPIFIFSKMSKGHGKFIACSHEKCQKLDISHPRWPLSGVLSIAPCMRTCEYCGVRVMINHYYSILILKAQSCGASNLRRHVRLVHQKDSSKPSHSEDPNRLSITVLEGKSGGVSR